MTAVTCAVNSSSADLLCFSIFFQSPPDSLNRKSQPACGEFLVVCSEEFGSLGGRTCQASRIVINPLAKGCSSSGKTVLRSSSIWLFSIRPMTGGAVCRNLFSISLAESAEERRAKSLVGMPCSGVEPPPNMDCPSTMSNSKKCGSGSASAIKVRARCSI